MRHVARQNRPRTQVHQDAELNEIQSRQTRTEKHPHPNHALIIHQVEDVLSYLKVAVLRELFLQVPTPAVVHEAHEDSAEKIHVESSQYGEYLSEQSDRKHEKLVTNYY